MWTKCSGANFGLLHVSKCQKRDYMTRDRIISPDSVRQQWFRNLSNSRAQFLASNGLKRRREAGQRRPHSCGNVEDASAFYVHRTNFCIRRVTGVHRLPQCVFDEYNRSPHWGRFAKIISSQSLSTAKEGRSRILATVTNEHPRLPGLDFGVPRSVSSSG
jgi:hypothetical protein